jgi:uncharacterized protein YyaL (SSP411 family)
MIAALVNAAIVFAEPRWIEIAKRAFDFIAREMGRGAKGDQRLGHSWREGKLLYPGLASDFAAMIRAAIALNEATGHRPYLDRAIEWQTTLDRHYANPDNGGYYLTADDAEGLVVRPNSTNDDATPNPNALAAQNLIRLTVLAGNDEYRAKADRLIEGVLSAGAQNLFAHVATLNAVDLRLRGAEIVCAGTDAKPLVDAALRLPFVSRTVLRAPSADELPAGHPAQDKIKAVTGSAAFVCMGETCSLPVTSPTGIASAVASMRT